MFRYLEGITAATLLIFWAVNYIPSAPAVAQEYNSLRQSYRVTLRGDVVVAGVGLREQGTGEITIPNLPATASVVKAFLYWATIGTEGTFNSLLLNDETITGTLIGNSANTCWEGPAGLRNFVYRADVTDLVDGDGVYLLDGLPYDLDNGNDSQGASLVVIYAVTGFRTRTIIINDGATTLDFNMNTYTDTIEGFEHTEPLTSASVTYIVGDGQSDWGSGDVTFNGEVIASDVFNGVDGDYWDTLTFDVTALNPTSPSTTTISNLASFGNTPDCLVWAATVFSATSPSLGEEVVNILRPFFNESYQGAVTAAGVGMRGTGRGEISVTNVPPGSTVIHAYLYWATIGTTGTYNSLLFNGQRVDGERIGTSGNTCWPSSHPALQFYNFVYRADVTEIVPGNGDYLIEGLPDSLVNGNDSQGASLVVVYPTIPGQPFNTIIINDGAATLDLEVNTYTDTITGFNVSYPLVDSTITYIMGDGQSIWDSGNVKINDVPIATNIFNGVDGAYWGTIRFNITNVADLNIADPTTTTINNMHPDNGIGPDCLLWAVTVFSATPPQPEYAERMYMPIINQQAGLSQ
jgi:hypothetical protein